MYIIIYFMSSPNQLINYKGRNYVITFDGFVPLNGAQCLSYNTHSKMSEKEKRERRKEGGSKWSFPPKKICCVTRWMGGV